MGTLFTVHYGEIALKGKNRRDFENRLVDNIKKSLSEKGNALVRKKESRLVVDFQGKESDAEGILSKTFGVEWFSKAVKTGRKIDEISEAALMLAKPYKNLALKVETKRADKGYPLTSPEISRRIGLDLDSKGFLTILKKPHEKIFVEILSDCALVSIGRKRSAGGLPLGSSGKVVSLLSGGIDSPASSWLMMRRGCTASLLHIHPFPSNKDKQISKMKKIVRKLREYSPVPLSLYLAPYEEFYRNAFSIRSRLELVVFRRFIMRLAGRIAMREKAHAIVNGDNLGQVASQTIENIRAVSGVSSAPVFRPLIGYTKAEIIELAKRIGTYEQSLLPYRDCCSLISQKHPATKAKAGDAEKTEKEIGIEKILDATLKKTEKLEI